MPVKKNRTTTPPLSLRRRTKTLFLPMPQADADALILNFRVAVEVVRSGGANATLIRRLATMVLLTRFLTEAGHGMLERAAVEEGEGILGEIYERGTETGDWTCSLAAIELLVRITNEYDRQLRETRLEAVIDASNRLDRVLDRQALSRS